MSKTIAPHKPDTLQANNVTFAIFEHGFDATSTLISHGCCPQSGQVCSEEPSFRGELVAVVSSLFAGAVKWSNALSLGNLYPCKKHGPTRYESNLIEWLRHLSRSTNVLIASQPQKKQ